MTTDAILPPRANRHGSICPDWCTQNHGHEIIPGVYADTHCSDPGWVEGAVLLRAWAAADSRGPVYPADSKVMVAAANGFVSIGLDWAEDLAKLLECLAGYRADQVTALAAMVRAAAATARDEQ